MILKKYLIAILFFMHLPLWAQSSSPLLVLDMRNAGELPKNFRTTSDPILSKHINLTGFAELHAIGSGQFSMFAFKEVKQRLSAQRITIVDLREESHGFLDGNAVSWYGPQNAANAGKNPQQIEMNQAKHLNALSKQISAVIYKMTKNTEGQKITQPIELEVYHVLSERIFAKKHQLEYQRFYIQDHHIPNPTEVNRFIAMVKQLPVNGWVYFHCRAGVGRTTLAMMMYDILRNAKQVSYEDIFARQVAIGGKDLSRLPSPHNPKYIDAKERLQFIKKFHQYVHENQDDFQTSWSTWLKQSSV